ncbi:MAG: hypothetical protein RR515_00655 [Clostridium sp.]
MDNYVIIIVACLTLNLILVFTPLKVKSKNLRGAIKFFILIGVAKYISLLIFYTANSPRFLYDIRMIPVLSIISIFALGYIIICYIDKTSLNKIDIGFLMGIVIVGGIIVYNNSLGIRNSELGYILIKNKEWIFIEAIYTIVISVMLIVKTLKVFVGTKITKKRVSLIMVIISFAGVCIEEGLSVLGREMFHFNILSELIFIVFIVFIISTKSKGQV